MDSRSTRASRCSSVSLRIDFLRRANQLFLCFCTSFSTCRRCVADILFNSKISKGMDSSYGSYFHGEALVISAAQAKLISPRQMGHGTPTLPFCRQTGSRHDLWNLCLQFNLGICSPFLSSSKQIGHISASFLLFLLFAPPRFERVFELDLRALAWFFLDRAVLGSDMGFNSCNVWPSADTVSLSDFGNNSVMLLSASSTRSDSLYKSLPSVVAITSVYFMGSV